jgi:hypothetical protein
MMKKVERTGSPRIASSSTTGSPRIRPGHGGTLATSASPKKFALESDLVKQATRQEHFQFTVNKQDGEILGVQLHQKPDGLHIQKIDTSGAVYRHNQILESNDATVASRGELRQIEVGDIVVQVNDAIDPHLLLKEVSSFRSGELNLQIAKPRPPADPVEEITDSAILASRAMEDSGKAMPSIETSEEASKDRRAVTITIVKSRDKTMGINTQATGNGFLEITKENKDGLIDEWNYAHRNQMTIGVADLITRVNDIVGDPAMMKKELQKIGEHTITVQYNAEVMATMDNLAEALEHAQSNLEAEQQLRADAEQRAHVEAERALNLEAQLKAFEAREEGTKKEVLEAAKSRTLMPGPPLDVANSAADVKEVKRLLKLTDRMRVYGAFEQVLEMFEEELRESMCGSPQR